MLAGCKLEFKGVIKGHLKFNHVKVLSKQEPLEGITRFILSTISQKVDLNCCFLATDRDSFYCRRDLDGADLISCEDCQVNSMFIRSSFNKELRHSGDQ